MVRSSKKNKCLLAVISVLIIASLLIVFSKIGQASTATDNIKSQFRAGYIIGDLTMQNKNSLNENDIQSFLKSKNSCNNTNRDDYNYWSNKGYQYDWKDGHFVCMADELFNGQTAAHIIWQASQDYGINPEVLIVLLQKEQGLVTDTWPNSIEYSSATGYSCPDNGSCDSSKSGFENQIRGASSLFSEVMGGGWSNYPVGINYVQYNPSKSCGGSNVNIVNYATSALYRYTPYQPNDSALNSGYGSGDSCGAYGNRNFWLYFNDWFGNSMDASNVNLVNGLYRLNSTQNKSLTVTGASTDSGTKVQIWSQNNSGAQDWQLTNTNDGYYTLMNVKSGKYLDVTGGNTAAGTRIQIWDGNGTDAQKWAIVKYDDRYRLVSKVADRSLDISNAAVSTDGAPVQIWDNNNNDAQKWEIIKSSTTSNVDISNGVYRLNSAKGKSLDVTGASTDSGTKVQIWSQNNSGAQDWQLTNTNDGYYTLMNVKSGKYLDVTGGNTAAGTRIQIWDGNGTDAQKWAIVKYDDRYRLVSKVADRSLDISNAAVSTDGAPVQIWDNNNNDAQKWEIIKSSTTSNVDISNGVYRLNSAKGKSLDVTGASTDSGTKVQIWSQNNSGAQDWQLTNTNDGYYTLMNVKSGKYLDVTGGNTAAGTRIQIWDGNGTDAQKWAIVKYDDRYRLVSKVADRSLDISNAAVSTDGAPVQIWDNNNNDAQKWEIVKN